MSPIPERFRDERSDALRHRACPLAKAGVDLLATVANLEVNESIRQERFGEKAGQSTSGCRRISSHVAQSIFVGHAGVVADVPGCQPDRERWQHVPLFGEPVRSNAPFRWLDEAEGRLGAVSEHRTRDLLVR